LPSTSGISPSSAVGGGDDISPKSILSKDGKNKKIMPHGTHVQFSRDAGVEDGGSTASASINSNLSGRKRIMMAPHLSRSPYDDYYDYPPRSYHHRHHLGPPPHPYYDSPPHHHHRSRYHPNDDPYYSDPYHPYAYHPRGGSGGRYHHHGGPPLPSSHYYDQHGPPHDFPHSPSPIHSQYPDGGGADSRSGEDSVSASGRRRRRSPSSINGKGGGGGALPLTNFPGAQNWSKEEDAALRTIMNSAKDKNPKNWSPIGHKLGRSPDDCRERWTRYLKPGSRKGQWTEEEDNIVINAVQSVGDGQFTRWSDLVALLPGRVGKQIRDRWVNHLNPNISHLPFSREDDLLLWEGHSQVGKKWVEISGQFFKGIRSENQIKNRWYSASFKKFINSEFGDHCFVTVNKKKKKSEDDPVAVASS